ncbi:hypothetical protein [Salinivibrio sp. YCSC6]|uniref:hypothetical protein n=1 Tax=Salinivibrio sp. YCSC6 TaxID=2003370 RepID=UPI000BBC2554|nr:hypothetical protein [Salinivibrio sp. YCSC6]PCE68583.1 hypothetical protein B6G00_10000 [Salinivibrio sp. YCSC6]QCF36979.1 hypothetical protein E8E00_12880 [Salinivibrio sp. YCSC6]
MEYEVYEDNSLVLAAEDFDLQEFSEYHFFTSQDRKCISKLRAHGPVLLKGARGCGKSALMIEASMGLYPRNKDGTAIGIYVSLRHLDLLRTSGAEYIELFCKLVIGEIQKQLPEADINTIAYNVSELQQILIHVSSQLSKRIVLLFDDAAHIGRETSLSDFFDIFRTLSNNTISCKASIYPGVTKFGTRFDVYNDATVIDVNRSETASDFTELFVEVLNRRFSTSLDDSKFAKGLSKSEVCKLMGVAVLGNMRSFIYSCNQLITSINGSSSVTITHLTESFKQLSNNYFWPLLEEIEPKLGVYEPMVNPAQQIAEIFFEKAGEKSERSVLILREIGQRLNKPLEILEYVGFIARKEVSRAMKSRGRGTRYVLNLCNITEYLEHSRISPAMQDKWLSFKDDSVEFHRGSDLYKLELPEPLPEHELDILNKEISILKKSNAYPYGLTDYMVGLLDQNDIKTLEDLVNTSDDVLLAYPQIGPQTLKRVRSTVNQAIWM